VRDVQLEGGAAQQLRTWYNMQSVFVTGIWWRVKAENGHIIRSWASKLVNTNGVRSLSTILLVYSIAMIIQFLAEHYIFLNLSLLFQSSRQKQFISPTMSY